MNKLICRSIRNMMNALPQDEQANLKRIYAKTWTIAVLEGEGLANPTNAARPRLLDLEATLRRAHGPILTFPTDEQTLDEVAADCAALIHGTSGYCDGCQRQRSARPGSRCPVCGNRLNP